MRIPRLFCTLALILLGVMSSAPVTHACPACQDNVNSSSTTLDINGGASGGKGLTALESGYSWSVVFLITMPFAVLSFLVFAIYKECQKMENAPPPPRSSSTKV